MRKDLRQLRPEKDRKKMQNKSESAQTAEVGLMAIKVIFAHIYRFEAM